MGARNLLHQSNPFSGATFKRLNKTLIIRHLNWPNIEGAFFLFLIGNLLDFEFFRFFFKKKILTDWKFAGRFLKKRPSKILRFFTYYEKFFFWETSFKVFRGSLFPRFFSYFIDVYLITNLYIYIYVDQVLIYVYIPISNNFNSYINKGSINKYNSINWKNITYRLLWLI